MKRTLSAMALTVMLGAFTLTSAGAAANAPEEKKPESNAVKETQQAIDNLRSAVKDFENALERASKDENLKRAIESAQSALDSAQKSMEHAKMFTEKYAPGRSDKDMEKGKENSSPEYSPSAPSDLTDEGTVVSGTKISNPSERE